MEPLPTGHGQTRRETIRASELRQMLGDVEYIRIAEIIATGATREEVEIALAWARGESDVMGAVRKPLSGRVARVHEILRADDDLND